MKQFATYIAFLLVIALTISYVGDLLFTQVYYNGAPRDKIRWVRSEQMADSLDYVLLGSSRCIHNVKPALIGEMSGKKGLNLGYAASGPVEIKLMLQQIVAHITVEKVFIQVDNKYNTFQPDDLAQVSWMPYIKEPEIYAEFQKYDGSYWSYKNIPFYRYQIFEPKIGIRNVGLSLLGKEGDFIPQLGYKPVYNVLKREDSFAKALKDRENPIFNEMIEIGAEHNIEIFFFTAPIYNNHTDFSALSKYLPNYKDFSNAIGQRDLFADVTHLNEEGAERFTELFCRNYFLQ